jgi:hypothetical protein
MSHLTKNSKANIVDKAAFIAAMKDLGYTKVTENTTITMYDGTTLKVDVGATNGKYSIGLLKNATGKYDLVGDFQCFGWELTKEFKEVLGNNVTDKEIQDAALRYTTKHTITNKYRKLGFNCQASEDKLGNIQVTMTKF